MEAWKSIIKEEPRENKCYEDEAEYYDNTLDSYSTLKSKQLGDVKIESREEFYSTFNSGEPYNVKIESEDEFYSKLDSEQLCDIEFESKDEFHSKLDLKQESDVKSESEEDFLGEAEENNNLDACKSALSNCYPELSIPLERLECSQNQEVIKYLKPQLAITSPTKFQSAVQTTELNLNLKTESVELETLTENTLVQSPKNDCYASPWDFVSVSNTFDQNSLSTNAIKTESEDENLPEQVIKEKYGGGTSGKFSTYKSNSLSGNFTKIQNTTVLKKKFNQQTINFDVVSRKHRDDGTSKLQTRFSDPDFSPDESFYCELCDEKFETESHLAQHECNKHSDEDPAWEKPGKKIKKPEKKFSCKICGRPSKQSLLRQHYATHNAIKRYECDTCKKKFKTKRYLREHLQAHEFKQYACKYCSRLYRRKSTLRRHMKLHSAGYEIIVRKYTPKTQLKFKKNHDNGEKATDEAASKLYDCDVCGQRFGDKSSMKVHIEFLHIEIFGDRPDEPQQPQTLKPSLIKPFRCGTCHKRYTQSSHLKRHQESHLPSKSHICELCGQNFSRTSSLTRHLRNKHDVIRSKRQIASEKLKKAPQDFTCKICGKALTNLGDLRRHCATHDARKPYECDLCKKQFAVKGYLYAHILTHDNWKPYPCILCPKVYRRKSSLQRHIQISHSGKKKKTNE